jgi:hypothetical protein
MTTETNQENTLTETANEAATAIDVPNAAPEQSNVSYQVKKPYFPPRFKYLLWIPAFAGMTLLFMAQKARAEVGIYNPPNCEFQVDLPSQPYTVTKCNPDNPKDCHDVTTFTKVFDMAASVDFTLTCNPAEKNMYEKYSAPIMLKTLEAMVDHDSVDSYEKDVAVTDAVKRAVIIGSGTSGKQKKIYTVQLWIGHKSVFTIEGSLVGDYVPEADTMFADIVKSIKTVDQVKKDTVKVDEKNDKKEDKKAE